MNKSKFISIFILLLILGVAISIVVIYCDNNDNDDNNAKKSNESIVNNIEQVQESNITKDNVETEQAKCY